MRDNTFPLDVIMDALDSPEDDDIRVDGYSGRGMYGKTCAGIVFAELAEAFAFFARLGAAENESMNDEAAAELPVGALVRAARIDGMGRGTIVYFPGWTFA